MRQKSVPVKEPATQVVKNIRRATRRHFSAEDIVVWASAARFCVQHLARRVALATLVDVGEVAEE